MVFKRRQLPTAMFRNLIAEPTSLLLCILDFCSITECQTNATNAFNGWITIGRRMRQDAPSDILSLGEACHKETASWRGVMACVSLWLNELYRMAYSKPKFQSCLEAQWLKVWGSSLLDFRFLGWLEEAVQSENWVEDKSKWVSFKSVTFVYLVDRFTLEPKAL